MIVTYLGHSCFLIEIKGKRLLFDPFISGNPLAKDKIDVNVIKTDYVLISHGHVDHCLDAEKIIRDNKAFLISNNEIIGIMNDKGLRDGHPFNLGGKHKFEFGTVRYVYANHSSVMPDGTYAGNPGGFIINSDDGSFYFAGDTGLTNEMRLIGDYYNVDYAFLPIGGNYTMDVDDAVIASDFIKCNRIIGMHYNSWQIISIDTDEAMTKFSKAGKELILFNINETKTL